MNNVENVYVQSAAAGNWTVDVVGHNVPVGPQPFALVIDGVAGGPPIDTSPNVNITSPIEGNTVSGEITVTADASDDNGVNQVAFFVNGSSNNIGTDTDGEDGWSVAWDTTNQANGQYTLSATVTDSANQTATDSVSVIVANQPQSGTVHLASLTGDGTPANRGKWSATVTISTHDESHSRLSDVTVTGTWSSGGSGSCVTDGDGQCQIVKNNIKTNVNSTTFTIMDISHATNTYDSGANEAATAVAINKP